MRPLRPRHRNWPACQCSMCLAFKANTDIPTPRPTFYCPPAESVPRAYILGRAQAISDTLTEAGL